MRISRNRKPNLLAVALLAVALLAIGAMQFESAWNSKSAAMTRAAAVSPGANSQDNSQDSAAPLIAAPAPLAAGAGEATVAPQNEQTNAARAYGTEVQAGAAKEAADAQASPAAASEGSGLLSSPFFYYLAGAVAAIALLLNLFKVSFAPEMAYDSAIFKTLSSDTRMELLASLQQRRKTLTELATERKISLPGAKQHLELLEGAGLVKKIDEGRKWKYYELTVSGKTILAERYS